MCTTNIMFAVVLYLLSEKEIRLVQLGTVDYQVSRGCHAHICFCIKMESNPLYRQLGNIFCLVLQPKNLQLKSRRISSTELTHLECDMTHLSQASQSDPILFVSHPCHHLITYYCYYLIIYQINNNRLAMSLPHHVTRLPHHCHIMAISSHQSIKEPRCQSTVTVTVKTALTCQKVQLRPENTL